MVVTVLLAPTRLIGESFSRSVPFASLEVASLSLRRDQWSGVSGQCPVDYYITNPELRITHHALRLTDHVNCVFAIALSTRGRGGALARGRMLRDFTYSS